MRLTIKVHYRTPSLNLTKRMHWTQQMREKRIAFAALASALQDTARDRWTLITSPEAARICSMASDTLALFLATNGGAFPSKRHRSKLKATGKNLL